MVHTDTNPCSQLIVENIDADSVNSLATGDTTWYHNLVNTGLDNGLLPVGTKPLLESVLISMNEASIEGNLAGNAQDSNVVFL